MPTFETTKMSSKGQIVIPEETRTRLGLKAGDRFLVIGDNDVLILKTLSSPSLSEFDALIQVARKRAKALRLKRFDIGKATARARQNK